MNNTKEMQEKMRELLERLDNVSKKDRVYEIEDFIREYEESEEFLAYFDTDINQKSYEKYANVDKYIDLLDSYDDKIYLAQVLCDFELAQKLFSEYPFSEDEKEKFDKLSANNEDITKTLRPKILSDKYNFFSPQILDFITAENESAFQDRMLRMNKKNFEIFKILYRKIENDTQDIVSKLFYLSVNISDYEQLNEELYQYIQNGGELNDDISSKLLWLYTKGGLYTSQTREISNSIRTIDDINNLETIIRETCNKFVNEQRNREDKNIDVIKESILMSTYGMTLEETRDVLAKYNLSGVEINEDNQRQCLMYLALTEINSEDNPDKLIAIYDEYTKENYIKIDYLRTAVFNGELKELFAKEFNRAFTPIEQFNRLGEDDGILIYDAGTNFKICMTAVGAYQDNFSDKENYSTYWNSKKIMAHTSSCSLIANNNLTTAKISNICLGFSNFEEEMFYGGSNKDMASDNQYHVMAPQLVSTLSNPEEFINSTRGQYNELVYERRDLGNGKFYKKNPDFIVFFEEFDDLDNIDMENPEVKSILNDEKRKWQESLKAAKNFGVPIVKINRERCAKAESEKIEQCFQEYLQTHDTSLLSSIITNFENNRTGTRGHSYLTEKYFSSERLQDMLNQISSSLEKMKDEKLRQHNIQIITKLLTQEKENVRDSVTLEDIGNGISRTNVTNLRMGIDVDEYISQLEYSIKLDDNEIEK